ncbi:MAG: ATP-binding protein [Hespellia sp.]|nr:ATP-binding protein [Hespellia sp.]
MVNVLTGPKGSGKTQQMIELANQAAKVSNGNVVLIKKSHRNTYSVDFSIRTICMTDYKEIETIDAFKGFLYGMAAGNHDIESVFIDSVLKQADISLSNLPSFLNILKKISEENHIDFFVSIGASKEELSDVDLSECKLLN